MRGIDAGELRQVDLQHQGDQLKATFKLAHSIPHAGTFGTFLGSATPMEPRPDSSVFSGSTAN